MDFHYGQKRDQIQDLIWTEITTIFRKLNLTSELYRKRFSLIESRLSEKRKPNHSVIRALIETRTDEHWDKGEY